MDYLNTYKTQIKIFYIKKPKLITTTGYQKNIFEFHIFQNYFLSH